MEATNTTKTEVKIELTKLEANAKLSDVIEAVNKVITVITAKRDRGPDSEREMTEADAIRVISGDLKDAKHAKAAEALKLSYGQVYSARKGFTFKTVNRKSTPWA